MARSVGIDAGDYSVKAVELDGSYKKARLLSHRIERVAIEGESRVEAVAEAAALMLKDGKMSGDVALSHPCREAVLRTIEVPFKGDDAIRKVIKTEVEGAIHSHAVDDMVVDFFDVGGLEVGSRVLVAAVPKAGLRPTLSALEEKGVEPLRVDLDTMALYRAADFCGAFAAAPAGDAASGLPVGLDKGAVTAVLDLGARSTRVLLVEGSRLVDMRTLRLGDASIVDALVRTHDLPLDLARDAVRSCLAGGAAVQLEVAGDAAAAGEEGGEAVAPSRSVTVGGEAVAAEREAYLQRLSRELVRFLASSGRAVTALYVTGGASTLEGMQEALSEVFGVEPRPLDVLSCIKHSLSPDEAAELGPRLAVAVGLALASLGGPTGFDFRREDLAFTRGFDRVKFPLAIACMVALFAAVVFGVRQNNQLKNLEYQLGLTFEGANADPKRPRFYGQLHPVLASEALSDDRYFRFQDGSKEYGYRDLLADLQQKPVAERVKFIRDRLRRALDQKQKESGIYEEVSLESGLAVMERFFGVLSKAEPSLGRYLLCTLDLSMRSAPGRDTSGRYLQCRIAFRGDDFRERFAALRQAVEEECQRDDSPFERIEESIGGDMPFRDGAEKGISGAYFDLKVHIRESFAAFGVGS